jgi:uncharacterized protein (TIGR02118 family)
MIVVFSLMRRRDDVPVAEFRRHWLDPHGPLVCKFPRLRRYSQNHVTASGGDLALDGFAELAYDSDADQEAATGSPEMAACDRDSPLFIGSVLRVVCTDRVIVARPAEAAKAVKQIAVFAGDAGAVAPALAAYRAAISKAAGLLGLVENIPLRQRGPRSKVAVLDFRVAAIVESWFADADARAHGRADQEQAGFIHTYPVTEYRFI